MNLFKVTGKALHEAPEFIISTPWAILVYLMLKELHHPVPINILWNHLVHKHPEANEMSRSQFQSIVGFLIGYGYVEVV